jgi:DNA-directed RNA polymerase specialized sigma24 family protein
MESLEVLVSLHGQRLFRLAYLLAGDQYAAEDLSRRPLLLHTDARDSWRA